MLKNMQTDIKYAFYANKGEICKKKNMHCIFLTALQITLLPKIKTVYSPVTFALKLNLGHSNKLGEF